MYCDDSVPQEKIIGQYYNIHSSGPVNLISKATGKIQVSRTTHGDIWFNNQLILYCAKPGEPISIIGGPLVNITLVIRGFDRDQPPRILSIGPVATFTSWTKDLFLLNSHEHNPYIVPTSVVLGPNCRCECKSTSIINNPRVEHGYNCEIKYKSIPLVWDDIHPTITHMDITAASHNSYNGSFIYVDGFKESLKWLPANCPRIKYLRLYLDLIDIIYDIDLRGLKTDNLHLTLINHDNHNKRVFTDCKSITISGAFSVILVCSKPAHLTYYLHHRGTVVQDIPCLSRTVQTSSITHVKMIPGTKYVIKRLVPGPTYRVLKPLHHLNVSEYRH